MKKENAFARIAEVLDELDALTVERKEWLDAWKLSRVILTNDLNMCRDDVRQMRLGEDTDEVMEIRKAAKR